MLAALPDVIRFGGDAIYPPFEFSHKGEARGFNVDLAKAMGDIGGKQVEYELDDWPVIVEKLEKGEVDIVPMFVSESRAQHFAFSPPFYVVEHAIYAAEGVKPVYMVHELAGLRIAVEDRSYALEQLYALDIDVVPVLTANTSEALTAVQQGRAEYAILAIPSASRLISDRKMRLRRLGPPIWPRSYAFAVRSDRTELLQWVQDAFAGVVAGGVYKSVYDKWRKDLPNPDTVKQSSSRAWIFVVGGLVFLLIVLAFVRLHHLRRHAEKAADQFRQRTASAEFRAAHLHSNDGETGLPRTNRFVDQVDEAIRNPSQVGQPPYEMLILELTELSSMVYALGREQTDQLVRDFANGLTSSSRGPVGYLGRGLFAVFSTRENIRELSELVHLTTESSEQSLYSRLVSGSSTYPEHGTSAVELLKRSETALTVGRSTGRRWMMYSASMEPDPSDLEILECFRTGNLEGLYPVFQPKLDLTSGAIIGAEALVRWDHPRLGMITPIKLISLAEKGGFISLVTRRMLDEAVRFSSTLRREGLPSSISVNISILDLSETDLPELIQRLVSTYGGRPQDLNLELTETIVTEDFEHTQSMLARLHNLGLSLSVDDFGTGFSSLSYLSFFPIDEVKIDRNFVVDMVTNTRNRSIVRSTVLMAQELGLRTVAEGAEDAETQAMLAAMGCDQLQGYVFSKPLLADDYRQLLRSHAQISHASSETSGGGESFSE